MSVSLGFLVVLFLLACTAAFSAAVESAVVPLFTDPSLLLCCNIIIMGVVTASVENSYANCGDVLLECILPVVFLLCACYYDVALRAMLFILLTRVNQSELYDRTWFAVSVILVPLAHGCPLVVLLVASVQPIIAYASVTLTVLGCLFGVLFEWQRYNSSQTLSRVRASAKIADYASVPTLPTLVQHTAPGTVGAKFNLDGLFTIAPTNLQTFSKAHRC